jgi:hypothetical protein
MAKVTGPLMSLDASGGFAGTLVFGKWKGRNVVRQLVTPSNPQSELQEDARNGIRAVGQAQKFANASLDLGDGRLVTDKQALIDSAPAGQAWNGWLAKCMIGLGAINLETAQASWVATSAPNKVTWDAAADALTPPILAAYQTDEFGVAGTPLSSGNVFWLYTYGLFIAGIGDAPVAATPPVYA